MPRRQTPDPLALRIGQRIRHLRKKAGLSLEKLAYESELGSKGHLSDLERGLTRPTITTLQAIAARLGVALLDLVTFPDEDERQRLVEALRALPEREIERLVQRYAPVPSRGPGLRVGEPPKDRGDDFVRRLGERLRERRLERRKSAEEVAARAGLETESYLALEEGEADPTVRTLVELADALEIAVWDLFRPSR
jgi:transcriptional regulator with XRE-family HTH domain